MNTSEKLLEALKALHALQSEGTLAVQSNQLSRLHRERLCKHGFLQKVLNGWYIPSKPDDAPGETTAWYTSFWTFCATYLAQTKGNSWCVSPEQSISLHVGNWTVPKQLLVRTLKARNNVTTLLHNTSLLVLRSSTLTESQTTSLQNIRVFTLPAALCNCSPEFFKKNPSDCRAALLMIDEASELLRILLDGGHSVIAGRLAAAFRNVGKSDIADDIVITMKSADHTIRETDPFSSQTLTLLNKKEKSPYVNRIRLMWENMRSAILPHFEDTPALKKTAYLQSMDAIYLTDAYHSLSIEGYHVTENLIERVKSGKWNPDQDNSDIDTRSALAARGYWQAYQQVRNSIIQVLDGSNAGSVAKISHKAWYREMFAPSVSAGIIHPTDLAGYRDSPVFIRQSMHVSPSCHAVRELMPAFFTLLEEEKNAAVRAILGHFIFVYIHPYTDGNGRMGRFLMNLMLASGGYPWLVIPLNERPRYMTTLEEASVNGDIEPFTRFIAELLSPPGKPNGRLPPTNSSIH